MASISRQPNGRKTIQFVGPDRKRRSIRLGKCSLRHAEAMKVKVEQLVTAAITGHVVDDETARWVTSLDDAMTEKLASVGLIPERVTKTLEEFLESYIASRNIKKENTLRNYNQTRKHLINYFGASKILRDITQGDADEWRESMLASQAETTVSREVKRAKQFFRAAVRKKLIPENPFADLPCPAQINDSRKFFVTVDVTQRVIDACPDAEWRLIVALGRYGGLRCPSEHLRLAWLDVDWERDRITIHASKTEHHRDGGIRQIPIFPELRPYLEDVWQLAPEGTEYVISKYRQRNANLRTQLCRIIERAGLDPWPKLFQNLRTSRETELADHYPPHVVCYWMGNSEKIAQKHYLQVTDDHFERASGGGAKSGAQPVQNAVQQPAASSREAQQKTSQAYSTCDVTRDVSKPRFVLRGTEVPPRGVEPLSLD